MGVTQQDLDRARVKLGKIKDELAELGERDNLSTGEETRLARLLTGHDNAERDLRDLERDFRAQRVAEVRAGFANGTMHTESGDGATIGAEVYDRPEVERGPMGALRSAALRTLDQAVRSKLLPAHAAEKVETLVSAGPERDRGLAARWAVATGAPEYRTAFAKLLGDPQRGHLLWTDREAEAYRQVTEVRAAMSLTDANGGFMVPLTLDPAIMLTSDGSINPLRRISRVVQTVTDQWQGVSSAGTTSEWKAENAEAADGSPTVGDEPIPVHFGDTFVQYSFEVGMDAVNFLDELSVVMADSADNLMNAAYTTGTGSGQPTGFVTALAGTSSEINSGGSEALIAADAFTLQNALPARFSARAQWGAHIATINTFRQFETTNGALKFPELANGQLLGKPMNEISNMDGTINAAATANNYLLIYGDFTAGFVIVDRIGTQLEIIPNLVGANRRPTGTRGAFLWFRTGSNVVVPQAFRLLDVPTTA